jgi:hypothetical protein
VQCPKCRLVNPPSARRCDCGWDLTSSAPPPPRKKPFNWRRNFLPLAFSVVFLGGVLAFSLYEYFYQRAPVGHFCRSDGECRGHCLVSDGVCTDKCDDDRDCPSEMKCGEAASRIVYRTGGKSDPHLVKVCVPR